MGEPRPLGREDVERKILGFIAARVGKSPEEIPLDVDFGDVGLASLDALDILFAAEEEFGLTFDNEDARGVRSAGALIELTLRELAS